MRASIPFAFIFISTSLAAMGDDSLVVESHSTDASGSLIHFSLPADSSLAGADSFVLVENETGARLPAQGTSGDNAFVAQLDLPFPADSKKHFTIDANVEGTDGSSFEITDDGLGIQFEQGAHPFLRYNYKADPERTINGMDPQPQVIKRSGYIDPVWTPSGRKVTEGFPSSYFHHLGVWGAWVNTRYQGTRFDFWNLKSPKDIELVSFTSWEEEPLAGPVFSGFVAKHRYTLQHPEALEVLLDEALQIKAFTTKFGNAFDYTLTQEWLADDPLALKKHRYGGTFAWRYPSSWDAEKGYATSSEGHRQMLSGETGVDATHARWIKVHAFDGDAPVGFLMMSHPDNFRHPELTRMMNNGPGLGGYIHFTPVRSGAWKLEKGDINTFKYRAITFDGTLSEENAELLWKQYAEPPKVTFK
ncbi:MAG: DUF6807 family protein [Opitutales bacterium]